MCEECNLLTVKRPDLVKEWDFEKNIGIDINKVTCGSRLKVWWICKKPECRFKWLAIINNRARKNSNCGMCSGRYVNKDNCLLTLFPQLSKELDPIKNILKADELCAHSHKKVWWICKKCKFNWEAPVEARTSKKTNRDKCPRCWGQFVDETNCLLTLRPDLCEKDFSEKGALWDFEKNIIKPTEVAVHSNKKVWWICKKCKYSWRAQISRITRPSCYNGCGRCNRKIIDETNCLLTLRPTLCKEWDWDKNKIKPTEVTSGTEKKIWWICKKCKHSWKTRVCDRALKEKGCPICNKNRYSKKCSAWIDSFNDPNIFKSKPVRLIGNKRIEADGIDYANKIIYEFYGKFFHGDPRYYKPEDMNKVVHKTFGELYENTIKREELIKQSGYKLITIWESDWDKIIKEKKLKEKNGPI